MTERGLGEETEGRKMLGASTDRRKFKSHDRLLPERARYIKKKELIKAYQWSEKGRYIVKSLLPLKYIHM